ncbi:uncharacterized protein LOC125876583 isoform X2 [Solanum stenotomum]|uniref:uncharacterized protein LOC125876583 isoform X1 n=1 Tax=Solanum stenotomum TaxID=172797 RepID=UPI0020D1682B|nr:uncharacterized protein LOC125876583 isoform X1 [Solanum stenotomum]XP_049413763.1 uncharacterized protein LOC125876583 isoform X2 [Solanum stenotomum]
MAEDKHQPEIEPEMDVDGAGEDEEADDEVFYERIEAPKFVDFSTPDYYRPDDRYWFCLRVGCDQKHEEEMDSEKIYKDFVLRVMAARSPNVRLQKALSRHAAGKNLKCPLTVPAKFSKSRLSKLAAVSTISRKLIEDKEKTSSHKLIEDKEKAGHPSKSTATPKIRGRQVAAKYLTTPRNKKCLPNPNSFHSVQNPKPAALDVPRNRIIAKALVFHSPKKAISLKKSVELRIPLTKLCQGIKKLEITDQKKRLLNYSGKSKDTKPNCRDAMRNRNPQKDKSKTPTNTRKSQTRVPRESRPLHSTNIQNQAKLGKQCPSKNMAKNECSKTEVDLALRDGNKEIATALDNHKISSQPANFCSAIHSTKNMDLASADAVTDELKCDADQKDLVGDDLPQSQLPTGEDHNGTELNTMDHSICEGQDSDDKENVSVPDENRSPTNNLNQTGQKVLGVQKIQKIVKKNAQPAARNLKESLLSTNAGASGMKPKKPKPTNPKPFRLRTDERGILREADLQRKKQGNVEDPDNKNRCTKDNPEGNEKDSKGLQNDLSNESGIKSSKTSDGKVRLRKSSITPERSNATQLKTANLRNAKSPMVSCLRQGQQLTIIQEASADNYSKAKALTPSRMLSHGRRPLTIPKEPHFHSTHRPKSCTRNLVEQVPM